MPERAKLIVESAHHADAIFDLRVIAVMHAPRHTTTGAQVNLVAEKSEGCPEAGAELALERSEVFDRAPTKLRRDGCQSLVRVVARQAERDNRHALDARVIFRQLANGALKHSAVVDLWTQDDLRVNLNACVEHSSHLGRDVCALSLDA